MFWPMNTYVNIIFDYRYSCYRLPVPVIWVTEFIVKMAGKRERSLTVQYLEIGTVVSAYWIISISMVFLNKKLLSGMDLDAPLFVTLYQCICSASIIALTVMISKRSKRLSKLMPKDMQIKSETLVSVLPLSLIFVSMITFNNLCLKYVGVAFYFVGRSLTTVFNVILTYIVLGQKTSYPALICCCLIIVGFFLGVDQEGDSGSLSIAGVVYGVLASLFVSLNAIHTKKTLPIVDHSVWSLNLYNSINAIILLTILMVITGELQSLWNYDKIFDFYFWFLMTVSGVFGFAIGFVTALQIQVTTPLTHNVSGTAKAAAQTVLACIWFQEVKTTLWWISNIIVMVGSAAYARVRQLEMAKTHSTLTRVKTQEDSEQLLKGKEQESPVWTSSSLRFSLIIDQQERNDETHSLPQQYTATKSGINIYMQTIDSSSHQTVRQISQMTSCQTRESSVAL